MYDVRGVLTRDGRKPEKIPRITVEGTISDINRDDVQGAIAYSERTPEIVDLPSSQQQRYLRDVTGGAQDGGKIRCVPADSRRLPG